MTSFLTSAPSLLSLAAAGLYACAVIVCIIAAGTAMRRRQQQWHLVAWALLALLFAGLAVLRFYGVEEALRNDMRFVLYLDGLYDERRSYQRPVAAVVVTAIALGMLAWIYTVFRRLQGRRNIAVMVACFSAFSMVGLVILRLISLSPVDALLYGPVKLNWIIDLGSSLAVLASAGYYVRLVGREPAPLPKTRV